MAILPAKKVIVYATKKFSLSLIVGFCLLALNACQEGKKPKPTNEKKNSPHQPTTVSGVTLPPDSANLSDLKAPFSNISEVTSDWPEHIDTIEAVYISTFSNDTAQGAAFHAVDKNGALIKYGSHLGDPFGGNSGDRALPEPSGQSYSDCFENCVEENTDNNPKTQDDAAAAIFCGVYCVFDKWEEIAYKYDFNGGNYGTDVDRVKVDVSQ